MSYTKNPRLPKLRMQAVKMVRSGQSIRAVGRYYGYTPSTISRWVKKAPEDGRKTIPTESSRPHKHPKTLPPETVTKIIQKRMETNRCCEVVHYLRQQDGVDVSLSSVKRWLGKTDLINKKSKWKKYRPQPKRPPVSAPGELTQMDTIHLDYNGKRYYIFTFIDVYSRWAHARFSYKCNQHEAWETFSEAKKLAPFEIQMVQTDNGPEFKNWFRNQLRSVGTLLRHGRVRKPNDQAHCERYNRTLQQECLFLLGWQPEPQQIIQALKHYTFFYNHQRPHLSLNFLTPYRVLQSY